MKKLLNIPISEIYIDEAFNCRGQVAPIDVLSLAESIKSKGLIQPISVCPHDKDGKKYRLLAGFMRTKAHQILKRKTIDAVLHPTMSEVDARCFNLAENLARQDLNIVQEAMAVQHLKDLGLHDDEICEKVNKSRGWLQVRNMLLTLPIEVQDEAAAGFLTQSHIRDVYSILVKEGITNCYEAVKRIKEAKLKGYDRAPTLKNKKPSKAKKPKKRPEIFNLMLSIQTSIGNSILTRLLAWCAGEITDEEIYEDLKDYDIEYSPPKELETVECL